MSRPRIVIGQSPESIDSIAGLQDEQSSVDGSMPYTPDSGIASMSEDHPDLLASVTPSHHTVDLSPLARCNVSSSPTTADLVSVQATAVVLAQDVVHYLPAAAKHSAPPRPPNSHAKTLRRTVDALSERHRILFESMVKKLQFGEPGTSCESFVSIANEMFADGQINWGRIVTLYAFAGWLARYCVESEMNEDWVRKIGDATGKYVGDKLGPWIVDHGGWEEMDRFFPEEENMESMIWRGLLYTMLGLGALATTVAVVR